MYNKQKRIICAAIWYGGAGNEIYPHQPLNIQKWIVICGLRHTQCIYTAGFIKGIHTSDEGVEGFLTNTNVFVTREAAADIAFEAQQIRTKKPRLTSEDLY